MTKEQIIKLLEQKLTDEQKKLDSLLIELGRAYYSKTDGDLVNVGFDTYKISTERSRVTHSHQRIAVLQHSIREVNNCNHAETGTAGRAPEHSEPQSTNL